MKQQVDNLVIMKKNFKDSNKLLQYVAVPLIMSDFYRIKELEELREKFNNLSEDSQVDKKISQSAFFKFDAIDTYISHLKSYMDKFTTCITSNLKGNKVNDELIPDILQKIIKNSVVIANDTDVYNCHGWSFGLVKWLGLDALTKDNFLKVINIKRILEKNLLKDFIDDSINSYFSSDKDLKESVDQNHSIIGYYDENSKLMHTARYIPNLTDWFKYDEDSHEGWYNRKPSDLISFEEDNICLLNGYVSKLGEGFLLVHNSSDIAPLYGDTIVHYDYS